MVERQPPYSPDQLNFVPDEYIAAYESFAITVGEEQMTIARNVPDVGAMTRDQMLKELKRKSEKGVYVARYFTHQAYQQEVVRLRQLRDKEIEDLKQSGVEITRSNQLQSIDPASLTLNDVILLVPQRLASEALRDAPKANPPANDTP